MTWVIAKNLGAVPPKARTPSATAAKRPNSRNRRVDLFGAGNRTPLFGESAPGIGCVRNHLRVRIAIAFPIRTISSQAVITVGVKSDVV